LSVDDVAEQNAGKPVEQYDAVALSKLENAMKIRKISKK